MKRSIALMTLGVVLSVSLLKVLFLTVPSTRAEEDTWPTGDEIAQRINARDEGEAVSRTLVMEMIDRRGKKRVRKTKGFRKYYGEEKRTVIFYRSPKNIRGTAFLTFDYPDVGRDDDQWLYLPAMRKVRRISAADRGDYFLGTDFTFEDIKKETKVGIEDYRRKTVGEGTIDGHPCYIVESLPVSKKVTKELGYSRLLSWVDKEIWMVRMGEFWDVRGNPLKTSHFRDIRQVQGIWTVHRMEVRNHKTGHQTIFTFSDVDYRSRVNDDVFTKRALRRGL